MTKNKSLMTAMEGMLPIVSIGNSDLAAPVGSFGSAINTTSSIRNQSSAPCMAI